MSEEQHAQSDDVVAKYKKLLNLARSNLEANKDTINEKDKQIASLRLQIDELKLSISKTKNSNADDNTLIPRQILSIVNGTNSKLWVLIEYTNVITNVISENWVAFETESELDDFIQRLTTGPPLVKPSKLLSVEESVRIVSESKSKLDIITEEFRK